MNIEYEIKFRDIDPDTGYITQDSTIALTIDLKRAELVKESLERNWFQNYGDPNREFYITNKTVDG